MDKIFLVKDGAPRACVTLAAENDGAGATERILSYIADVTGAELPAAENAETSLVLAIGEPADAENKGYYSIEVTECDGVSEIRLIGSDEFYLRLAADALIARHLHIDGADMYCDTEKESESFELLEYEDTCPKTMTQILKLQPKIEVFENSGSALKDITDAHSVCMITGETSINMTRRKYDVCGVDLGFPAVIDGKLWLFYGDTFAGANMIGGWRSNSASVSTGTDWRAGIVFDSMYSSNGEPRATEMVVGLKRPHIEYSKIPTGAISVDGKLYFYFMSVKSWGTERGWDCNYGGLAKSEDGGKTWQIVEGVRFVGLNTKFCQCSPVLNEADGKIYITGIRGGRTAFCRMMRVDKDKIEDFEAYEYLVGRNEQGEAEWLSGFEGLAREYPLIDDTVSENTIFYNEYLGEWIIAYKNHGKLRLYTSKKVSGPYTKAAQIAMPGVDVPLYGFLSSRELSLDGGKRIAFIGSSWKPCYNTFVFEITLER